MKRNYRSDRSKRGRYEPLKDNIQLDTSKGLPGVLYQVALVTLFSGNSVIWTKLLGYINSTVRYIIQKRKLSDDAHARTTEIKYSNLSNSLGTFEGESQLLEDWDDIRVKEKYFCIFRTLILHRRKEVRVAGLRLFRYMIHNENDVKAVIKCNAIPLIVRCIDICLGNHSERVHGIRLARHLMQVSPELFPLGLARCLVAVARDGAKDRDRLLRSAQALLNELAILNPKIFVDCGGVSCSLYGSLDCPVPRINEALVTGLLYLLNDPHWRLSCSQFHMIVAPFSDIHYKHYDSDSEYYNKTEERELRIKSSCCAMLTALRSWPGFIILYQPQDLALKSLIDLMLSPQEATRTIILDFLFDLFRVPNGECYADYEMALKEHTNLLSSDPDAWRLHEGFVVAEAKVILPHITKFRPNLILNYFSLLLYTLMKHGLFAALCNVIVTSSQSLSVKAAILLGELLHQTDRNIPDCGMMYHALPLLSEKAAGSDPEERVKASQAITALLHLSRSKLSQNEKRAPSLYLNHILTNGKEPNEKGKVITPSTDPAKMNKWLSREHDDLIQATLKDSGVVTDGKDSSVWQWKKILPILRWPSNSFLLLEDNLYRTFIKKLLHYFKPSSKHFSVVHITDHTARQQAEALVLFCQLLLGVPQEDQEKFLGLFLSDISSALVAVSCDRPSHDSVLSPLHLKTTVSQYYFLAIGTLTKSLKGYEMVMKANIYDQMMGIVEVSLSDIYAKLIVSTLDFSINGLNRTVLGKILTGSKECNRLYATQLLRVLARARSQDFTWWGIEFLVGQLYDESQLVALAALDILDEALDDEEYLEAVLKAPPSVQHLGDKGQLLLAKMVSSVKGFRTYLDCNFINTLLDKWANTINLKYVNLIQTALSEALTHLQRGDDGLYGRRTGSKHLVHDVYVLPHLYGSLTLHKEGFSILTQHPSIPNLIKIVKEGNVSSTQEMYKLKAAIWALGHLGRSTCGVNFLASEDVISSLVQLAASCPVYSVRGTVFHALCLLAVTWEGANILQTYGWETVRRHHHESVQLNFKEVLQSVTKDAPQQRHRTKTESSDVDDHEVNKSGFYFLDESEDEAESLSLLMEDLYELDTTARKSQTLPHDSRPSSYLGHQRSFSDCAPVIEELNGSSLTQISSQDSSVSKRSSQLKNKILSSFRRSRSSKRRDSAGSKTSNSSSASEKVLSFLNPSRRRKREKSSESTGENLGDSADFNITFSHSMTDCGISDEEVLRGGESSSATKLGYLALSVSEVDGVDREFGGEQINRKLGAIIYDTDSESQGTLPDSSLTAASQPSISVTNPQLSLGGYGFHKLRAISGQRRGVSESSHDELQSKNSLRDFLSSSYDQSPCTYHNMVRSSSGCSELSSILPYSGLGPRGGSSNWLLGKGCGISSQPDEGPGIHSSGQCYMGLTLPLDLDKLLLDPNYNAGNRSLESDAKDAFPNVLEKDFESHFDIKKAELKNLDKKLKQNLDEDSAFEFHSQDTCITCFSFDGQLKQWQQEKMKAEEEDQEEVQEKSVMDSPSLQRVKINGATSELSHSSSVNSQSCDEQNAVNKPTEPLLNRYLVRKEILKFVSNLSNSFIAKSSEAGLLALKHRLSWAFQDPCLYSEICVLLSSYSYRLSARRFIQELFLDLSFKEVFQVSKDILTASKTLYENTVEVKDIENKDEMDKSDFSDIPEYNLDDFEGFDMQGEET